MTSFIVDCSISNKYPPSPTVPFKNTSGEISIQKSPRKSCKDHKQPTTQPSGICSPPIKSTPRSPLKAARSRTEESTWAGQTPRRRPRALRRLVNENIRYRSHEYTTRKRNKKNLKITLKRGIIVVRTSRVWYDNCALWYCNCCFKIRNDYKKCAKN